MSPSDDIDRPDDLDPVDDFDDSGDFDRGEDFDPSADFGGSHASPAGMSGCGKIALGCASLFFCWRSEPGLLVSGLPTTLVNWGLTLPVRL